MNTEPVPIRGTTRPTPAGADWQESALEKHDRDPRRHSFDPIRPAMRGPDMRRARRRPLSTRRLFVVLLATVGLGELACVGGSGGAPHAGANLPVAHSPRAALALLPAVPAGAMRVALAFGLGQDLDLAVTDPNLETSRYAHPMTRAGGRFGDDRVCGDIAPRIEIVEFENACAGRYAIHIEHVSDCVERGPAAAAAIAEGDPDRANWVLRIDRDREIEWRAGTIASGAFQRDPLEIDLVATGGSMESTGSAAGKRAPGAASPAGSPIRAACRP